jgi:Dihaem cytochrome c
MDRLRHSILRSRRSVAVSPGLPKGRALRRRSPLLLVLLLVWSVVLGWGLAQATVPVEFPLAQVNPVDGFPEAAPGGAVPGSIDPSRVDPNRTVDVVAEPYRLGQTFYLENCATCHVGLPPAVMPSQTWADLLPDPQHYGVQIQPILPPTLQIVWNYVSTYSRPVLQEERVPYRLDRSRYFKALHPKVEFTAPITPNSCIACHPAAAQFDYRSLTPEWQNAP